MMRNLRSDGNMKGYKRCNLGCDGCYKCDTCGVRKFYYNPNCDSCLKCYERTKIKIGEKHEK